MPKDAKFEEGRWCFTKEVRTYAVFVQGDYGKAEPQTPDEDACFASIDVGGWSSRIQIYGRALDDTIKLQDFVLKAIYEKIARDSST